MVKFYIDLPKIVFLIFQQHNTGKKYVIQCDKFRSLNVIIRLCLLILIFSENLKVYVYILCIYSLYIKIISSIKTVNI